MLPRPLQAPDYFWFPKLTPWMVPVCRPFRRRSFRKTHKVEELETRGVEHLKTALETDQGILITPNHPGSADPLAMYSVGDEAGTPMYFMAAWQLFANSGTALRFFLRRHGVFSVDREGTDLRSFRKAISILQEERTPLVIFPEGEVYHINDRVTPFREGAGACALSAAKRGTRPVTVLPAAVKYTYLKDPTPQLTAVMDELEERIFWRPQNDRPLHERIYRFAQGPLALKELEYLGHTREGKLPDRLKFLTDHILSSLEEKHGSPKGTVTHPERIKQIRQKILKKLSGEQTLPAEEERELHRDLDGVFLVIQLFTYPGDYVEESPTMERVAETLDKFSEDILGKIRASVCVPRKVTVSIGEPISLNKATGDLPSATELTTQLEKRVQGLLDQLH